MLPVAHQLLTQGLDALAGTAGPTCDDAELISVLTVAEGAARRLDRIVVTALAELERRGSFTELGYRSAAAALADLLGCDRADARRNREAVLLADRVVVLGPRPTSARREVRVDLPRPRDLTVLTDPAFVAAEAELLGALVR